MQLFNFVFPCITFLDLTLLTFSYEHESVSTIQFYAFTIMGVYSVLIFRVVHMGEGMA